MAEHRDGAAVGARQSGENGDEGRLAGAVGAEQPEELACLDDKVDAAQSLYRAETARNVDNLDGRDHVGGTRGAA